MPTEELITCTTCATPNRLSALACVACSNALAPARAAHYLARTEVEIAHGQYNHARASLTKADVEMLTIDATQRRHLLLTAHAFYLQGLIYYHKGETEEARDELLLAAQNLTDVAGGEALLADVLNGLGNVEYYREHLDAAIDYYRRSSELAARVGAHAIAAKAIANLGNINTAQGDIELSLSFFYRALSEAEQAGNPLHIADIYRLIADVHLKHGPAAEAIAYTERSLALRSQISDQAAICRITSDAGNLYLQCGDFASAHNYLNQAYTLAQRIDYRLMQVVNLIYLADLMRQQGDDAAWLTYATRAFNMTSAAIVWRSEAALSLVRYYVAHQDLPHAQRYVQFIADIVRLNSFEGDRIHLAHAHALLHAAQEQWDEAAQQYDTAISLLTNIADMFDIADLQAEYATMLLRRAALRHEPETHAHARQLLEQATQTFRQLGLTHRLAPLEALLSQQTSNLLNRRKTLKSPPPS